MTPESTSFDQLISSLRSGNQDAAREIFTRFVRRLIGLARTHLSDRIRQKVDAEDVVQSVFKSFFVRVQDGDFQLADWDSLWNLLAFITVRKCGRKVEHFQAQRRDVRKESTPVAAKDDSSSGWEALASEPTPDEVVMLAETVEHIMTQLKERERRIFELHLEGYSAAEISEQVQRSDYLVQEVLRKVRKSLQRLAEDSGSA